MLGDFPIRQQNLGQWGNSEIPNRLGFRVVTQRSNLREGSAKGQSTKLFSKNLWWVITVIIKLLILLCVISFSISPSFPLVRMLFLFHQFSTRKSSLWLSIFVYKSHYRTIWSFFSFEFSACFKFRRGFTNFRLVYDVFSTIFCQSLNFRIHVWFFCHLFLC